MAAAVLSKITAPDLDRVIERESCFHTIDKSLQKRVVWVSAPGGSGKTTLAASYLKNRGNPFIWYHMDEMDIDAASFFYYMSLAVSMLPHKKKQITLPEFTSAYFNNVQGFAARYFKELFAEVDGHDSNATHAPFVIVFDNYQNAPADSIVHDVIARGLFPLMPEEFAAVVISRGEPPIEYAEIRRNDALGLIEWNDLLFTLDDTSKLVKASTKAEVPDDIIRQLHKKMDGWAAGLTLAIERGDLASFITHFESTGVNETIFDYFASEILENTEPIERECLLKTAYLREFSIPMAERLTGCGQTHRILSKKYRQYFITKKLTDSGVMFQYHDLFHDFLLTRAKAHFTREREAEIARRAVDILEENGHFEAAAQLCIDTSDIEKLSSIMLKHTAPMIAQGRGAILKKWFAAIPDDFIKDRPWLLYWKGMTKLQTNPAIARESLEAAYAQFKLMNDPEGLFSAFCAVIDTYIYEWKDFHPLDNWIGEFDIMAKRYDIASTPLISSELRNRITISVFSALVFQQPNHPNMLYWEEEALGILRGSQNIMQLVSLGHIMILYYLWTGRIYKASVVVVMLSPVIEKTEGHVLPRLMFYRSKALYIFYCASYKQGLKTIEEGLKLAQEYDLHMIDSMLCGTGIYNSLPIGNHEMAEEYFKKMESFIGNIQCYARIYYHNMASLLALSRGNYQSAIDHAEVNTKLAAELGAPLQLGIMEYIEAYVLAEAGHYTEARRHIKESLNLGVSTGSILTTYNCPMLEALIALSEKNEEQFVENITKGIAISKTTGHSFTFFLQSSTERLCKAALERNIEPDFIKQMIRNHEITPGDYKHDNWPYPVRIYTLGRFAIEIDGKPVKFSGKTQKKPLEILKAVIALGGKEVGTTQLSDAIWPDADGDAAATSFRTTLHRLRKILSTDYDIIISTDNHVSINPDHCWIDEWALRDIIDDFKHQIALPDAGQKIYELYNRASTIYKGGFLPGEQDQPWAEHYREQLKDEFVNLCCKAGTFYGGLSDWDKGIECYKSAIEADNLREECYRRTITFYLKAGLKPEAIALYNKCKRTFETQLGISPSAEIGRLLKPIMKVE
ncbi:BTAD domain-containing putative transcriptional regulator [Candidatus Magnetominusculus dajiuhuensis]|uniref:BTAD domain-containing putative transcriptional regulator n=1 Tax=Candidatus Magnetominusculus dajiuhuensis TaxID=3137712 RepID=UPI003B43661A